MKTLKLVLLCMFLTGVVLFSVGKIGRASSAYATKSCAYIDIEGTWPTDRHIHVNLINADTGAWLMTQDFIGPGPVGYGDNRNAFSILVDTSDFPAVPHRVTVQVYDYPFGEDGIVSSWLIYQTLVCQ